MNPFIFRVGVDYGWYSTPCAACHGPAMDDVIETKDHSCFCEYIFEDEECMCPGYYHRFTFTNNGSDGTHVDIETYVENAGARREITRTGESYMFDFVPISDDSDIEIFRPHVPLLKSLFMTPTMRTKLTAIAGRMQIKRAPDLTYEISALNTELLAYVSGMFQRKSINKKRDMRWITPLAKTICAAIVSSSLPVVKATKGCAHVKR